MFSDVLFTILDMLRPRRVIAIGRDAQKALADMSLDCHAVRHPSYGGQSEFISGMCALYGLKA